MNFKTSKGMLMAALITGTLFQSSVMAAELVEDKDIREFELNPMMVTATRVETDDLSTAAAVEIYDEEKIEKSGGSNAFEVLQNGLGLTMHAQGIHGASQGTMASRIMIRGVEKGTLIMLNGVAINSDSKYNLDNIPTDAIKRIEVVRGGGSVLYGSEATGGVINIITKEKIKNSVKVQFGNYGTERYNLNVGGENFTIMGEYENRGFVSNMSRASESTESKVASNSAKYHHDYLSGDRRNLYAQYRFNDALSLTYLHNRNQHIYNYKEEYLGYGGKPIAASKAYNGDRYHSIFTTHDNNWLLKYEQYGWLAKAAYGTQDLLAERDNFTTQAKGHLRQPRVRNSWRRNHITDIDVQKSFNIGAQGNDEFLVGASFKKEDMDAFSSSTDFNYKRNTYSVYASYNKALSDAANVIVNLRETWARNEEGSSDKDGVHQSASGKNQQKFTPEIQYIQKLNENSSFYAKAGKSFCLPELTKLFGKTTLASSMDLKPAVGKHFELGYKLNVDKAAYRVSAYHYQVDDAIEPNLDDYEKTKDPADIKYSNADIRNTGIELSVVLNHDDNWSSNWGVSYGNPQIRYGGLMADNPYKDTKWHDHYSRLQLQGGVNYSTGKFASSLSANYVGLRVRDNESESSIRPQLFTDLHLSYKPETNHKIFLHVNNLLNRDDITSNSSSNYLSLGTNFMLGYEYSF